MERTYVTKAGLDRLRMSIEAVQKELKGDVAQEIAVAMEKGDLRENAEYEAAKAKQAKLGQKLNELTRKLSTAEVVNPKDTPPDIVSLGKKVTIEDLDENETLVYTILGDGDSDLDNGIISYQSPLARGIIGHSVDEEVEVQFPKRLARFRITRIEFFEEN